MRGARGGPLPPVPEVAPVPPVLAISPVSPVPSLGWSNLNWEEFLKGGF